MKAELLENTIQGLRKAAELIEAGKVVMGSVGIMYGFATNALNVESVATINKIKGREGQPMVVCIRKDEVDNYAYVPLEAKRLIEIYWPGYLSIVVHKKTTIPDYVVGNSGTVALLNPPDHFYQSLLSNTLVPIIATSGNRHGDKPVLSWEEAYRQFGDEVDAIVKSPKCVIKSGNNNSTQVSFINEIPEIWRKGLIPFEELKEILPNLRLK